MSENDLVADILQRISERKGKLTKSAVREIESEVRRDWGGGKHYVARVGECGQAILSERDAAIRAQHRRGDHVKLLSRRWGLSERRIRQILIAAAVCGRPSLPAANDEDGDE